MPHPIRLLTGTLLGTVCGALFGVFFGALASVFENGPELVQGITESWPWFAGVGAFMGFGSSRLPPS